MKKYYLLFIVIIFLGKISLNCYSLDELRLKEIDNIIKINENNLKNNLFTTKFVDPKHNWLSVANFQGVYTKQFYSRDTFITFIGGIETNTQLRDKLAYAIEWFGSHLNKNGYLPIWFQETDQLNTYNFCPYNLNDKTGGIKQLDHQLEFIDAIYLYYKKTNNTDLLKKQIKYIEKSIKYLMTKTNNYLLVGDYSDFAGNDWADQVKRSGKSSFINAYWYKILIETSELEKIIGNENLSKVIIKYSINVKNEFNKTFWIESNPTSCPLGKFGHYIGWIRNGIKYDYFELDSNGLAIASGLSNEKQTKSILNTINNNYNYFINKYGATRVLCGTYNSKDTMILTGGYYQNGGYWYIPSYYLTMAFAKNNNKQSIIKMYKGIEKASLEFKDIGLTEWYYENGKIGGALNYSWSLGYAIFVSSIIKGNNTLYKLK